MRMLRYTWDFSRQAHHYRTPRYWFRQYLSWLREKSPKPGEQRPSLGPTFSTAGAVLAVPCDKPPDRTTFLHGGFRQANRSAPAYVNRTKVPLSCSSSQPFSMACFKPAEYSAGVALC